MSARQNQAPRRRRPELEVEAGRSTSLGYEAVEEAGFVRCLDHGFPTPLARWHCHEEYELHFIVATSGKAFVGDWIGQFQPGHLVLTGPRLPHNWVSYDVPPEGVALRDRVIQFHHEPLLRASAVLPELAEAAPVLERARRGIEFFGIADRASVHFERIRSSHGLSRLAAFCEFMSDLARCNDYRLLSSVLLESGDDAATDRINDIVTMITDNISRPFSMAEIADSLGMSESAFSRFFRRATGNNFIDFVNRVRISRACLLLMESNRYVTQICYDVGFNNVANFNRRFLEIKGMTPTEFRRQSDNRFGG